MRIAIAGKGGTGKTTIAGTLARSLAREGRSVVAIDADTNPNLAAILGLPPGSLQEVATIPYDVLERWTDEDGKMHSRLTRSAADIIEDHATDAPDGVRLLVMGRVGHSGAGCLCRAHSIVRMFVGDVVEATADGTDVVLDMEAGLEHLSRGTGRHATTYMAVLEPYFRSLETARRVAELARESGIPQVYAIANKVRDASDRQAVTEFCAAHGLELVAEVPYDPALLEAERAGRAPLDHATETPAIRAIRDLAARLPAIAA